jgi:type 1 glutamine amidotransferase
MAKCLAESGMNIKTAVRYDKWPESSAFTNIDAIIIYCDGDKRHIALGHEKELQKLSDSGIGIAALHYAVDGEPGILNDTLMNVIGGYYKKGKSRNPIWTVNNMTLAKHPVTNGLQPFKLRDEWYYNINLGDVTPIMSAQPPGRNNKEQTLVWVHTTKAGSRGAGFTGGHFHSSWAVPENRKLVLNLIAWTAGVKIPESGISTPNPIIPVSKDIRHAVSEGNAHDVRIFIILGADVNQKNKQNWSLLHFAAVRGKTECAEVLIGNGAEENAQTSVGKTPLHYAAARGFFKLARLLVRGGAKLDLCDAEGWTPLHYAAEKDKVKVAGYLLSKGAKVNALSKLGGTPLHEAAASASPAMIKLLLKNGADKSIKADNGKTPYDYSVELNNKPVAEILK